MISIHYQRIIMIKSRRPIEKTVNQELQYFGTSLGLFSLRDKDKSCFRIFIELLKSAKIRHPSTSDEIAYRTNLTRGTVIHHINRLIEAGIVVNEKNRYMLRVDNLVELVDEIEKDVRNICTSLKEIAGDIDTRIGLNR